MKKNYFSQISFKASYRQIPSISEEMYQRDVAQFLFAMLSTYLASGVEKKFLFLNLETILQCKPTASIETRRRKIKKRDLLPRSICICQRCNFLFVVNQKCSSITFSQHWVKTTWGFFFCIPFSRHLHIRRHKHFQVSLRDKLSFY